MLADGLRALADDHGVVLHPHAPEVWVAHPFATAPTLFVVARGEDRWWSPCAWCAFGAAALVDDRTAPVTITTTLAGDGPQRTLHVRDGALVDRDLVVHFPVPMRRAWDNVVHTCSVMLLFDADADLDGWCARHRITRGDVVPVQTAWAFAGQWYGRHLDPEWRKWTVDEAAEIFRAHGLTGPMWSLIAGYGRF